MHANQCQLLAPEIRSIPTKVRCCIQMERTYFSTTTWLKLNEFQPKVDICPVMILSVYAVVEHLLIWFKPKRDNAHFWYNQWTEKRRKFRLLHRLKMKTTLMVSSSYKIAKKSFLRPLRNEWFRDDIGRTFFPIINFTGNFCMSEGRLTIGTFGLQKLKKNSFLFIYTYIWNYILNMIMMMTYLTGVQITSIQMIEWKCC